MTTSITNDAIANVEESEEVVEPAEAVELKKLLPLKSCLQQLYLEQDHETAATSCYSSCHSCYDDCTNSCTKLIISKANVPNSIIKVGW